MSQELTGVATWRATTTAPASGDARTAASVATMGQDLVDCDAYMKERIDGSTAGVGINRIKTVADSAALIALTGMAADDVVMLRTPRATYAFQVANPGIQAPFQYAATDASGYWLWTGAFGLDDQLGSCLVVGNTATDKLLRPDLVANRIAEVKSWGAGTIDTSPGTYQSITGDTDWHDITDMDVTFTTTLKLGDIIQIRAKAQANGDATHGGALQANVYFDTTDHVVVGSGAYVNASVAAQTVDMSGSYTALADFAGSVTVKIQGKVANLAGTLGIADVGLFLEAVLVRP